MNKCLFNSFDISDNNILSDNFNMLKSTLLIFVLMMFAGSARPGMTWRDVTVMSVEETNILQIHADVVNTARA